MLMFLSAWSLRVAAPPSFSVALLKAMKLTSALWSTVSGKKILSLSPAFIVVPSLKVREYKPFFLPISLNWSRPPSPAASPL